MSEADLKNLSRSELLERLLEAKRICESLQAELDTAIDMADETKARCGEIEAETRRRCEEMVKAAKFESQAYWDEVYARIKEYSRAVDSVKEYLNKTPEKDQRSEA